MLSFFSKRRSISDNAHKFIQNISILIEKDIQSDTYDIDKVRLEVSKFLMNRGLESVPEGETVSESSGSSSADKEAATEVTSIAGETDFLLLLAQRRMITGFFEARKDAAQVFNNILRSKYSTILEALIKGYEHTETALPCGSMLRECIRYETLAEMLLYSDLFGLFLGYIESNNFDVASDAFSSFKDLLTKA
ncbi:Calcium-binding protein 39-like [Galdieria sulphuraria]|nr:Calcium-binding protein 39-like [Galdieria sulphuraria]